METLKLLLEELSPELSTMTVADLYEKIEQDDGKTVFKFKPIIDGMKPDTDVKKLHESLRKERNDHKALREKFKPFADRDPEAILAELSEIDELRDKIEQGNPNELTEEKIQQLTEKRLNRFKSEHERELNKLKSERDTLAESYNQTSKKLDDLVIGQALMEQATKKCDPTVIQDVMDIGTHKLKRNEEGEIVTNDDDEIPLNEWLTRQLETRAHWNKPSGNGGGGKSNNSGKGGSTKNPFSPEYYNFDRREWHPGARAAQDAYRREHGAEAADAAARSMGVQRPGAAPRRNT